MVELSLLRRNAIIRSPSLATGCLLVAVGLIGIMTHGLLLLTDYVLWDGWWVNSVIGSEPERSVLLRLLNEVGRPIDRLFYLPFSFCHTFETRVFAAKVAGTSAWVLVGALVFLCLRELARLPTAVAFAIAATGAASPSFPLLGEVSLFMNTACVLLFWLAWVLASRLSGLAGWQMIFARAAALVLFFISFDLNSNLVMFYAVAVAVAALRLPDLRPAALLARLPRIALRYADFLVLPIIFWLWKSWLTPTSGFYATGYNQPSLAPDRLVLGYTGMVVNFLFYGFAELFSSSNRVWAALIVAGVTAAITNRFAAKLPDFHLSRGLGLRLLIWGLFLLLSAAFPYIAVGQQLASEGWLSRNCILCPLPVAMISCGLIMMANEVWLPRLPSAWLTGIAALITLSAGACVSNYLAYQALGAKQLSIRNGLSAAIHETNAAVVQLRDYAPIAGTIPYYPPIIWTFIAHQAAGLPTSFVIETAVLAPDVFQPGPNGQPERRIPQLDLRSASLDQAITDTTMPYALEGIPRRGPQILAAVEPGYPSARPPALGLRYLLLAWFEPEQLDEFVHGFTKISTHLLPPVE